MRTESCTKIDKSLGDSANVLADRRRVSHHHLDPLSIKRKIAFVQVGGET